MPTKKQKFEDIAKRTMFVPTLELRNRDCLDFHDVSVSGIADGLEEAYQLGRAAGKVATSAESKRVIAELEARIAKLEKQAIADSWAISPEQMGR